MAYRLQFKTQAAALAATSLMLATPPVLADELITGSIAPAAFSGTWTVSTLTGASSCKLVLTPRPGQQGYRIDHQDCERLEPVLARASSWRPEGSFGLKMLDDAGLVLLEWSIGEFEGLDSIHPRHLMLTMVQESL